MIQVQKFKSASELFLTAAEIISKLLIKKPEAVIGLAAGATPTPLYALLSEQSRRGKISFAKVTAFNLDEYVGVPREHFSSFAYYSQKHIVEPCQIKNFYSLNGMAKDLEQEAKDYNEKIRSAGGLDLQILGVGVNGHVGFNEPGSELSSSTRRVTLSKETISKLRAESFPNQRVPAAGITLGIKEIMESRQILVLATGATKADAVKKIVKGPPTSDCPASLLQSHTHTNLMVDADAARLSM